MALDVACRHSDDIYGGKLHPSDAHRWLSRLTHRTRANRPQATVMITDQSLKYYYSIHDNSV